MRADPSRPELICFCSDSRNVPTTQARPKWQMQKLMQAQDQTQLVKQHTQSADPGLSRGHQAERPVPLPGSLPRDTVSGANSWLSVRICSNRTASGRLVWLLSAHRLPASASSQSFPPRLEMSKTYSTSYNTWPRTLQN